MTFADQELRTFPGQKTFILCCPDGEGIIRVFVHELTLRYSLTIRFCSVLLSDTMITIEAQALSEAFPMTPAFNIFLISLL